MIIKLFYRPVDFYWPHSGHLKLRSEPSNNPASSFSHEEPVNWFDLITSQGDIKSLSLSQSLSESMCLKKKAKQMCRNLCITVLSLWVFSYCPLQLKFVHNASTKATRPQKPPSTTSLSDLNHFHSLLFLFSLF